MSIFVNQRNREIADLNRQLTSHGLTVLFEIYANQLTAGLKRILSANEMRSYNYYGAHIILKIAFALRIPRLHCKLGTMDVHINRMSDQT